MVLKSYECLNACILNHMNLAGFEISGSDIFFYGRGFAISYQKGSFTRIKSEGYDSNFRFLEENGIPYRFGRISVSKATIQKLLNEPYTVTIRMISDCLAYDKVFSQTSGASHFVNVLDYDQIRKQFFIVDGDVPSSQTGCFSGWLDESELLRGWQLKGGEILQMDLERVAKREINSHVRVEANRQVINCVKEYLCGRNNFLGGIVTGEKAIYCMIEQLAKYIKRKDFRNIITEANFQLRVNGFLGAKYFLLEKFREQESIIQEEYARVVEGWSKWCFLLLKSGYISSLKQFLLVKERMEELVCRERQSLSKYLGSVMNE